MQVKLRSRDSHNHRCLRMKTSRKKFRLGFSSGNSWKRRERNVFWRTYRDTYWIGGSRWWKHKSVYCGLCHWYDVLEGTEKSVNEWHKTNWNLTNISETKISIKKLQNLNEFKLFPFQKPTLFYSNLFRSISPSPSKS